MHYRQAAQSIGPHVCPANGRTIWQYRHRRAHGADRPGRDLLSGFLIVDLLLTYLAKQPGTLVRTTHAHLPGRLEDRNPDL